MKLSYFSALCVSYACLLSGCSYAPSDDAPNTKTTPTVQDTSGYQAAPSQAQSTSQVTIVVNGETVTSISGGQINVVVTEYASEDDVVYEEEEAEEYEEEDIEEEEVDPCPPVSRKAVTAPKSSIPSKTPRSDIKGDIKPLGVSATATASTPSTIAPDSSSKKATEKPSKTPPPVGSKVLQIESESDFDSRVLQAKRPVLVAFEAAWCGQCKIYLPIFEKKAKEHPEFIFAKVNIDRHPALAKKWQKTFGIPTTRVFSEGQNLKIFQLGRLSGPELEQFFKTIRALHLPSSVDADPSSSMPAASAVEASTVNKLPNHEESQGKRQDQEASPPAIAIPPKDSAPHSNDASEAKISKEVNISSLGDLESLERRMLHLQLRATIAMNNLQGTMLNDRRRGSSKSKV